MTRSNGMTRIALASFIGTAIEFYDNFSRLWPTSAYSLDNRL
ncbi:hypothetical protein [Crossiella cryophila]|uniref:Uncharacterized protein n=1 Tax=Crossiella cryophila TaxID=43355 RepID=A0A7W7C8V9_9PSEU|nr:hypothetical protein [Crossiella cryophila]MBB4675349.1 hypothetical protein [Crossiella cryophila]